MSSRAAINVSALILGDSLMLKHPWGDICLIYLYLSGTPALLHALPANKPSRSSLHTPPPHPLRTASNTARSQADTHTHIHSHQTTHSHNLKGDIGNKFDTSAYPRNALRTKRNLILDKPPDRISALALCC